MNDAQRLLISSALALLCAPAPAFARSEDQTATEPQQAGEIVVTAQRRQQRLEDVPMAITALGSSDIQNANIRRIDAIEALTPSLIFKPGFGYPQTYIRGIGATTVQAGLESPVALYVDGASDPRAQGALLSLVDLASIEVLKGPQGTLYGRNAAGGAILVKTADPEDVLGVKGMFDYGRFNQASAEAVLNLPASSTLAFRFAGNYSRNDGYLYNLTQNRKAAGSKRYLIRGKVKWQPSSAFNAVLAVEHTKDTEDMSVSFRQLVTNGLCRACRAGADLSATFYQVRGGYRGPEGSDSTNVNLRMNYNLGALQLRTVSSYRKVSAVTSYDADQSALPIFEAPGSTGGKTYYQDIQLSSSYHGIFNFLIGAEYIHDNAFFTQTQQGTLLNLPVNPPPGVIQRVKTDSYTVFAEAYIKPVEALTITVGGRYLRDERKINSLVNAQSLPLFNPGGPASFSQSAAYTKFTPRAVVAYDLGAVNLYASYTRGFRAGGFKTPAYKPQDVPIRPENITSYEIGAKFVGLDRRLRLNVDAFRYDYKDVQVQSVLPGATVLTAITNAGKARGKGVEADLKFKATDWLDLNSGVAYLDARFLDSRNVPFLTVSRDGSGNPLAYVSTVADLTGTRLTRSPRWTFTFGANIEAPIGDAFVGRLSGTVRYTSSYLFYPGGGSVLGLDRSDGYAIADLTGGIGPSSGRYEVGFYVNNLTDHKYYYIIQTTSFGTGGQAAPPRTYGVRLKYQL